MHVPQTAWIRLKTGLQADAYWNWYQLRQLKENHSLQRKTNSHFRIEMKKVQVQMPDQCHAVLKDYANAWGMTMSEVMYEAMRSYVHKHSECCGYINSLMTFRQVPIDKRVSKHCYGHPCFACKHRTACGAGLYEGTWEMNPEVQQYIDLQCGTASSDVQN